MANGTSNLETRIAAMYHRDQLMAWILVVWLWATVLFVYFAVDGFITSGQVRTILIISGGLVLLFNTAAIFAMVNHYKHDRDYIYGLDIRHLDQARAAKAK